MKFVLIHVYGLHCLFGLRASAGNAMRTHRLIDVDRLDERRLKPIVKLVVLVAGLVLLWALVSNLPGLDEFIPWAGVSFGAILGAALTLGIVGVLVHVALRIEPLITEAATGPIDVAEGMASIVKHLVLFVAVIVAHRGLAGLLVPTLAEAGLGWTYDTFFLVLALIPTAVIAYRIYENADPIAGLLTTRMTTVADGNESNESTE